jgi:hypothetical protein
MKKSKNEIFDGLFVLELANNHLGNLKRGIKGKFYYISKIYFKCYGKIFSFRILVNVLMFEV